MNAVPQQRVDNFGAGPAVLPESVLQDVQSELLDYKGSGMSVMEISHRSAMYTEIQEETETAFRRLFGVSDAYEVLFLQGGASLQFAMLPLNFLREGQTAAYVLSGSWSEKAMQEAEHVGAVRIAASTADDGYRTIPDTWGTEPTDAYVHITSNNTIFGTQHTAFPTQSERPVVADMSSDILSRSVPVENFHMIYAGAQKNLGPAGVTVVFIRKSWMEDATASGVPKMLRYQTHVKADSKYNTPPVFPIYVMGKVLHWIETEGGLDAVSERNLTKARLLYQAIDDSKGFYRGYAHPSARSNMNVTFNLQSPDLEKQFIEEAKEAGFVGLAGHRSVGGCRASIYNALPVAACGRLAAFMDAFRQAHV